MSKSLWFGIHASALVIGLCGLGGMAVTANWWGVVASGLVLLVAGATATRGGRAALSLRGVGDRLAVESDEEGRHDVERANAFMVGLLLGLLGVTAICLGTYQAL